MTSYHLAVQRLDAVGSGKSHGVDSSLRSDFAWASRPVLAASRRQIGSK